MFITLLVFLLFTMATSLIVLSVLTCLVLAYHQPKVYLGRAWRGLAAVYFIGVIVNGVVPLIGLFGPLSLLWLCLPVAFAFGVYVLYVALYRLGGLSKRWSVALACIYPLLVGCFEYAILNALFTVHYNGIYAG